MGRSALIAGVLITQAARLRAQSSGPGAESPAAPAARRLSWVSCRVIAPATLQLIWHVEPGAGRYTVEVRGARGVVAADTTRDTTFTRGSLPPGALRIVVMPLVRGASPLNATATVPLRGGSARCGGS